MPSYSNIGNSLSAVFFPYGAIPPSFESNQNFQPYFRENEKATLTSANDGFVWLTERDSFYSENFAHTLQSFVTTGTTNSAIVKNVIANAMLVASAATSYAYHAATLLQHRSMLRLKWADTISSYLGYFRNINDGDVLADWRLNLGIMGVISIKKQKFGEEIQPKSFTATTSAANTFGGSGTFSFKDSFSGNDTFGILTETASGLTAGIIFYDLGIAIIHGPTSAHANSVSALTSISLYSTMKMWQYNFFCTVDPQQLNWTNNPNSFYNRSVSSDPDEVGVDTSSTSSISSQWYNWGVNPTTGSVSSIKGDIHLAGMYRRNPYITTVGLYNEQNELLAVAKISQPIRKPLSYPITFRIQLDLQ